MVAKKKMKNEIALKINKKCERKGLKKQAVRQTEAEMTKK